MPAEEKKQSATLGQRFGLLSYKVLCAVLRVTDIRVVAALGRCFGYVAWALFPSRRAIVARNFRIITDPTLRPAKLATMVRRNMVRTSMNLACSLKTGLMTAKELDRAIVLKGKDIFEHSGTEGRTGICCIPHAGNWELLARIRPCCDKVERFGSMYRQMSNPLLEQFVYNSRTGYGCEMYSKESGLKPVLQFAKTGGCLGVLCDQYTQEGLFLPYFGKMTNVTPLPALLHKRCKGKGTLLAVFTRNVALGRWEVELGQPIELPADCDSMLAVTMQVNLALEKSQNQNIMDGFWMHHRWKARRRFAPEVSPEVLELAGKYMKLPFRIIVCVPESFDEAVLMLPVLRAIKAARFDAQLTVVCPGAQAAYWRNMKDCVTYVATTDEKVDLMEQLDADELYKDGPFDYLFMFSENKKVLRKLATLSPIYISGFEENPLSKKFRFTLRMKRPVDKEAHPRAVEYLKRVGWNHQIAWENPEFTAPMQGNDTCADTFISPFSTLGTADAWPQENWAALVQRLQTRGEKVKLLHLPQDAAAARTMAETLGVETCAVTPESVPVLMGAKSKLYAVDGLLPQLAAQVNCKCAVLMASRQAERYAPLGEGHRMLTNHVACHPCYRTSCDAASGSCAQGVSVEELLGEQQA